MKVKKLVKKKDGQQQQHNKITTQEILMIYSIPRFSNLQKDTKVVFAKREREKALPLPVSSHT